MILHDGSTDIVIRDPMIRDAWEVESQIRELRNRNNTLSQVQSGPQYVLATFEFILSICDDTDILFKDWVDTYIGDMAEITVFEETHTCSIETDTIAYDNRKDWIKATITLRIY